MAARFDSHLIYVALALSVIAAVATTPTDGAQTLQKLQWLLRASTTPEAFSTAGAIDGKATFPVSP